MKQVTSENEGTVQCLECKEEIRLGASKCIHCESYQDIRRFLGVSLTFLSLLIALISVAGLVVTSVPKLRSSHTEVEFRKLESPFFGGIESTYLRLVINNEGYEPSMVHGIAIQYELGNGAAGSLAEPSYYTTEGTTGRDPRRVLALPVVVEPITISVIEVVFEGRPIPHESLQRCKFELRVGKEKPRHLLCGRAS